jgi:XTP/dITP diphosphohydrolase
MNKFEKLLGCEIVLATTNKGKVLEIQQALIDSGKKIKSITDYCENFDCEENGNTFLENALIKAQASARIIANLNLDNEIICLADDSGLCVESLGGEPGIYSARYFANGNGMNKILERLTGKSNRKACFVCALVLVDVNGNLIWQTEQKWNGDIAESISGNYGFGYDPIFIPNGFNCTAAEISLKDKNKISHRGQAINELKHFFEYSTLDCIAREK